MVPNARAAGILSLLYQLEASQWLPYAEMAARQQTQLRLLLRHARQHAMFYQEMPDPREAVLTELPLLTKAHLQEQADALKAVRFPQSHGKAFKVSTAGSTGHPVHVWRTQLSQLFWWACSLRDHLWHRRDMTGTMAIIRLLQEPVDLKRPTQWGGGVFQSGPAWHLPIHTDVEEQVRWLEKINPHYLLTYPANLGSLLSMIKVQGVRLPRLREVRTISEVLPPSLRTDCQALLGAKVVDLYSANEVGLIALECPDSGLLHVQSENLIVEVLDADGKACIEGEIGKVVITDLHNFAMPLIRYATGDYAEVGPTCSCGRQLPTLRRVLGRELNQALLPNGKRVWVYTPRFGMHTILPTLTQFQFIQESVDRIRVRLILADALTEGQRDRLTETIHQALGYPFQLVFDCTTTPFDLPPSGKFQDFLSLI